MLRLIACNNVRHLNSTRSVRMMDGMARAILVLAVLAMATGAASADRRISLDPRIALAVERDNLLLPSDEPASVVVQPRVDIDRAPVAAVPGHDRLWRVIDTTALVASTAALACDWGQTHRAAAERWTGGANGTGRHEGNPIMGPTPSTRTVNVYFAATAAVNVALWYALPKRYRSIVPAVLTAAETMQVSSNIGSVSLCGL